MSLFNWFQTKSLGLSSCTSAFSLASSAQINLKSSVSAACGSQFGLSFSQQFGVLFQQSLFQLKNNSDVSFSTSGLVSDCLSTYKDVHCDKSKANELIGSLSLKVMNTVETCWGNDTKLRAELKCLSPSPLINELLDQYYCKLKTQVSVKTSCSDFSISLGIFAKSCFGSLIVCGSLDIDWYTKQCQKTKIWCDNSLDGLIIDLQDRFKKAECVRSPLILDLDGDGVETIGLSNGVYFDHDNNGFAEKTGWAGQDDGLLVIDKNHNGIVDNGSELFGDNSSAGATNGFAALSQYDSNHDGMISAKDSQFADLKVWRDRNSNGITDAGELMSLYQAGIKSIATGYTAQDVTDAQGNSHELAGTYTRLNGSEAKVEDVWFQVNEAKTADLTTVAVSAEIKAMADLNGFGNVHTLHQAMQQDTSGALKALIAQFSKETNIQARQALMDQILYTWTGVQNVDPNAYVDNDQLNFIGDGRKIAVLEKFLGETFIGNACSGNASTNPNIPASHILKTAYSELSEYMYAHLNLQSGLNSYMKLVDYQSNCQTSCTKVNIDAFKIALLADFTQDKTGTLTKLFDLGLTLKNTGTTGTAILAAIQSWHADTNTELSAYIQDMGYAPVFGTAGNDSIAATSSYQSVLYGNSGYDILSGGAGSDHIYGGAGGDIIYGNDGNDVLNGGEGNDTYYFKPGDGADTLIDNAGQDTVRILTVSDVSKLWFTKQDNDLVMNIIGSQDKMTVKDWYTATTNHVEQFKLQASGQVLTDTKVDALVTAMASLTPPASGQTTLPTATQQALAPVLASSWT